MMKIAILHDTFPTDDAIGRLREQLSRAQGLGAALAVLAELPLDPWIAVSRDADDSDAEPEGGRRHAVLSAAASTSAIALLGGAIVHDDAGRRTNRALLYDAEGRLRMHYDKVHLPYEDGFWEAAHYEPGQVPPRTCDALALRIGIQICSDSQRPVGGQLLTAQGVELILAPRATPETNQERWRTVLRSLAITSAAFVVSANRPLGEPGLPNGGASLAIAPDGRVIAESTEALFCVDLDPQEVSSAKRDYPGYLKLPAAFYADAWGAFDG